MKSKEIYVLVGLLVLLIAFVWWGSTRGTGTEVVVDTNQEETSTTTPTQTTSTQNKKPSAAVTQSPTSVNPTVVTEKPVPVVPTSKSLAGSTFLLTTYNGTALPKDSKYTLTFTENNFTLKICNTLSSTYYIDGNVIKAPNVVSTKMYCGFPSDIMKIESDASLMFNSSDATIYRSGSTLILSSAQGVVMSFEGF